MSALDASPTLWVCYQIRVDSGMSHHAAPRPSLECDLLAPIAPLDDDPIVLSDSEAVSTLSPNRPSGSDTLPLSFDRP